MAFLMPPPYHSTKQLLLTSSKQPQYSSINNNDEQMTNRNLSASNAKYTQQMSSESDEFGFDMHSVVSMEILENHDQYKQTLKFSPQQKLTTFVEAKNQEVMRRVAEMQRMVENSQQYLNENHENGYGALHSGDTTAVNYSWRESSVDDDSDDVEYNNGVRMTQTKSDTNSPAPSGADLNHCDSLMMLHETISNDLNGINNGLNSIYTPFDCRSNGSGSTTTTTTTNGTSTTPSSVSNTPKVQRRVNGLSQIISDLQALGNDSSDCDSESLNGSPIRKVTATNNGTANQLNQLKVSSVKKPLKQEFRASFGLHSPDALGDPKGSNLREYLRQLKEASAKDNNPHHDLAAQKLAELYGFEIGDDSFIETDPDLIDLTTIPPPQTPDELDMPNNGVLNAPPKGFDDVDGGRKARNNRELEEFLKKVIVEPPTEIVTPAVELTPEELMKFIIPPPPTSTTNQNNSNINYYYQQAKEKPTLPTKPSPSSSTVTSPTNKPTTLPKPMRQVNQNCNSFYDNHHGLMSCCDHAHQNPPLPQSRVVGDPGTPDNNVKSKVLMFSSLPPSPVQKQQPQQFFQQQHPQMQPQYNIFPQYATVDRRTGHFNYAQQKPAPMMNGSAVNGHCSSDENDSLRLPPKPTFTSNGHTCGRIPDRPPKSAELQLKLNSPVKSYLYQYHQQQQQQQMHNYGSQSLYNNTDINNSNPPSLPPRVNELSPPPTDTLRRPPLPPIPAKPNFFPNSPISSPRSPIMKTNGGGSASSSPIRSVGSPHFQHRHYNTLQPSERMMFNFNHTNNALSSNHHLSSPPTIRHGQNGLLMNGSINHDKTPLSVLCSPQVNRKLCNHAQNIPGSPQLSNKNGHVLNVATLMSKTSLALSGLLTKLDQVAAICSDAQNAGGGSEIDEDKFQQSKDHLTDVSLHLVTSSKLLVIAMSDSNAKNLPEHLTACLTALRRITELAQDLVRFTSAPLQTRNIILKIHDVVSSFREMVCVPIGPPGAGQLALNANCLANVLATLLRSLRVFSP